jgi:hypothetical protein
MEFDEILIESRLDYETFVVRYWFLEINDREHEIRV